MNTSKKTITCSLILLAILLLAGSVIKYFYSGIMIKVRYEGIRGIALALKVYSHDYDKHLPPFDKWCDKLIEEADCRPGSFVGLIDREEGKCGYALNENITGLKLDDLDDKVVLAFEAKGEWNLSGGINLAKNTKQKDIAVVFADGYMDFVKPEDIDKLKWEPESLKPTDDAQSEFYSFTMNDIDGNPVALSEYQGKVVMVVNVASKCGRTKQYAGLEQLYNKYKDEGFVVLGFPANNFGGQEPGSNAEIKRFCERRFDVSFPMFSKISVKGKNIHPLYEYLTSPEKNGEFGKAIAWNFNKFLIDRDGKTVAYFNKTAPLDPQTITAVEKALKE